MLVCKSRHARQSRYLKRAENVEKGWRLEETLHQWYGFNSANILKLKIPFLFKEEQNYHDMLCFFAL